MEIINTKEELIEFCDKNGIAWRIQVDILYGDDIFFYDIDALVKKNYNKDLAKLVSHELAVEYAFLADVFESKKGVAL